MFFEHLQHKTQVYVVTIILCWFEAELNIPFRIHLWFAFQNGGKTMMLIRL